MERLSDEALVHLSVDGDHTAFAELVARHTPAMRRYASYLTSSAIDADEAVQEALITAWQTLDYLRNPAAVRSWMMKIVARKAIDQVRSQRPTHSLDDIDVEDQTPTPHAQVEHAAQLQQLRGALKELPENQRHVWVLREIGQLNYQEIAHYCGVSEATVRGRLARARENISRQMGEWR